MLTIAPRTETTPALIHAGAVSPADNSTASHTAHIPPIIVLRVETVAEKGMFDIGTSSIRAKRDTICRE